jgi:Protein of unknown function (DUF4245)
VPTDRTAADEAWARAQERAKQQAKLDRAQARTFRNLIWSLVACFGVIAFLAFVTWRPHEEQVKAIDYGPKLAQAREVAPYRVLAPEPMPAGWQATSAEVTAPQNSPVTWHLGVITADRAYVGLEQSNGPAGKFTADELGRTEPDGTSALPGWQRHRLLERDERALVRTAAGVTTIVTGTADYPTLEQFTQTLR